MTEPGLKKLVLDAGHGGHDPGAINQLSGLTEAGVVLDVVQRLGALMRPHCEVRYTRGADHFVTLAERCELANAWGADAFLSVHCNSAANNSASGFEFFTSRGQTTSDGWATWLIESYGTRFPSIRRRADLEDGDPDKEAGFYVLRHTQCASVLAELEFISNRAGADFLSLGANRQAMAEALALGTLGFLGLTGKPARVPKLVEGAYYWFRVGEVDYVDRVVDGKPSWVTTWTGCSGPLASPVYG